MESVTWKAIYPCRKDYDVTCHRCHHKGHISGSCRKKKALNKQRLLTGGQAKVTSSPSPICYLLVHANEAEVVITNWRRIMQSSS